ncbi:MAG: Fe-S cluster assembly ATPase SufC [Bacilli bacterium]
MDKLQIRNLSCSAEGNKIIRDLSLDIVKGDCLALLGPNGHGKSTLLNVLMGNPRYQVDSGSVLYDDEDLLKLTPDLRSKKGIFMAFQNPPDVPGVVSMDFFRAALNSHSDKPVSLFNFYKTTTKAYEEVGLDSEMASRYLNEGYSGGEKKRNEILQMLLLKPDLVLLDEIDSGLDVDAMALIASTIKTLKEQGTTFIIVSHYEKLFELVEPNRTAVIVNGRIAKEGDSSLAKKIASQGYSFLEKEFGINLTKENDKQQSIGVCAAKQVEKK